MRGIEERRRTGGRGLAALLAVAVALLCGCGGDAGSAAGGGPAAGAPAAPAAPPIRFRDVAAETGLDFVHFLGGTGQLYFPEIMGPGGGFLDYDGDGDLDVLLVQGSVLEPGKTWREATFPWTGTRPPRTSLYRNELIAPSGGGTLRFTDVTEEARIPTVGYGQGLATGDVDNDGDVDLFLSNYGPDVLLLNDGAGAFTDATARAGVSDPRWDTSATFFDADGDGLLDLFVLGYCDFTVATNKKCFLPSGARDYCGPRAYLAIPARFHRNLGGGRFATETARAGLDAAYGHGLGVVAVDVDGDGRQDLYVANDSDANNLWLNQGGRFADAGLLHGAAYNARGIPQAGMGIALGDPDDDGDPDLFVTNLINETNTLFMNWDRGRFEDLTDRRGLAWPSLSYTAFGVGWLDADNDADLDLFIANGDVRLVESEMGRPFPYAQRNQLMAREDGGWTDRTADAGPGLALVETSRAAAFGDVDHDGDVDVLVTNDDGPVRLLRNETPPGAAWVVLRVVDARLRRDAHGARVRFHLADGRTLTRFVQPDGSYLAAGDPRVHAAWPAAVGLRSVEIVLPDGRVLSADDVPVRAVSTVLVDQARARLEPPAR